MIMTYDDVVGAPRWPLSWSAIIAGALVALVAQFLLNLLGVGIGAATLQPLAANAAHGAASADQAAQPAAGGYLWWAGSGIIAAFLGGLCAGRIAKQGGHMNAMSHGFFAWTLATLVVAVALAGMFGAGAMGAANMGGPMAARGAGANDLGVDAGTAQQAMQVVAGGAIVSFIALIIGAVVALAGGAMAGRMTRPVVRANAAAIADEENAAYARQTSDERELGETRH